MTVEGTQQGVNLHLPEGWQEVPLSAVADVRFSSVDKLTFPSEKSVYLCNYIDVYKNDYITNNLKFMKGSATQAEIERFGLQAGDVIITKDSETPDDIAIPAVVDDAHNDLVCGYHLALVRPHRTQIDPTFLARQLGHHRLASYFCRRANGLTRYGLSLEVISNAPIWLPRVEEQVIIGRVARLVDAAIAAKEGVITKLKQMKAGLLHDLLTRGLDENGQLRDPVAHAEQFKDSPLGRIPRQWEVTDMGTAISKLGGFIQTGPFGSQLHADEYVESGVPVVMPQDILNGSFNEQGIAHVSQDKATTLARHRMKPNDVVFARRGDLSRSAPVGVRETDWLCGTGCLLVRVPEEQINGKWLSCAYQHERSQRQILARAVGTTMVNLNTKLLGSLVIAKPNAREQAAIVEKVEEFDSRLRSEQASYNKLKQLKNGLMQDLLTGTVRVNTKHEVRS